MPSRKIIAFVLFENALALNIAGPAEVFAAANRLSDQAAQLYELMYLSTQGGLVRTSSGVSIQTQPIASVDLHALDTVIVVVVFLHRPAGQAQFSRALAAQGHQSTRSIESRLESLHCWMVEHLDEDLGVERLAVRM